MSCDVAEPAGGNNVLRLIGTSVLSCNEMLCGTLKSRCFALADAMFGCELGRFLQPHTCSAVVATPVLICESVRAVLGERIGHERLLAV